MTQKIDFYTQIYTKLRSNLSADCLFVKAWGISPQSIIVSSEVKKLIGCNWPFLIVKTSVL